ncbi:MAG: oligopeptide transport system permease protein [Blastocatellia bacterium]|jgi:ABC-type dipeptide/oligopeptide/nickel transport system permease component|nr:oligopeptide transport system permease protein [Blastocatellia bacterium]
MARYILSRVAGLLSVLLVVSIITFALMHAVPGGPFDARALEKQQMIPDNIKRQLNTKYGLDQSVWRQYFLFLRNAARLDFGYSLAYPGRTVVQIFKEQWPYSFQLGLLTLAFSILVGLGLGIISAVRPNSWIDHAGTAVSIFCLVMPSFVFAVLLQFFLSVRLGLLPTGGWDSPLNWIMPVLANSLAPVLVLQRYTRSSMRDAMRAGYVRTARAKGLGRRRIMFVHVFKNALTPVLTVGGPLAAGLITGSFFVESIFRIPGIGFYFVTAIQHRDYPMIMATTLVWAAVISTAYLLTDLLYALADPRVTLTKGT